MNRKQKIRGKEYTIRKIANNLLRYYNLATEKEIEDGKNWYKEANEFCRQLASEYNLELWKVAGIVASLSPQTSWDLNRRFARQFISQRGRAFIANRDRTIKAKNIYKATDPGLVDTLLATTPNGALKTRAFFKNIMLPEFDDTITIDRHHLAVSLLRPERLRPLGDHESKMTHVQYRFLTDACVYAARKVNLLPNQLQGILWLVCRRLRGLDKPSVMDGGYTPMDIEDF